MNYQNREEANHRKVWFLVEHPQFLPAYATYAKRLVDMGHKVRVVNAPEVFGVLTKDAIVGNAERLIKSVTHLMGLSQQEFQEAVTGDAPDLLFVCGRSFLRPLTLLGQLGPNRTVIVPVLDQLEPTRSLVMQGSLGEKAGRCAVDGWIVPLRASKERLIQMGAYPSRALVGGFPISEVGRDLEKREAFRSKWGFSQRKLVLVRAAHFSSDDLERLMFHLSLLPPQFHLIFHHEGQRRVGDLVKRLAEKKGLVAQMFGEVDDMTPYLLASDLLITDREDLLNVEATARRLPIMVPDLSPYEASSSRSSILQDLGGLMVVDEPADLPAQIMHLLDEDDEASDSHSPSPLADAQEAIISEKTSDNLYQAIETVVSDLAQWHALPVELQDDPPRYTPDGGDGYVGDDLSDRKDLVHANDDNPFEQVGRGASRKSSDRDTTSRDRSSSPTDDASDPFASMRRQFSSSSEDASTSYGSEQRDQEDDDTSFVDPFLNQLNLSKSEAKAIMTELILVQRNIEEELSQIEAEESMWYRRLELARTQDENSELEDLAKSSLKATRQKGESLRRRLKIIEDKRRSVAAQFHGANRKSSSNFGLGARAPEPNLDDTTTKRVSREELERKFQELESDARLNDLKRRMDHTPEDD